MSKDGQECTYPHIKTIGDHKTNQQCTDQPPPNEAQCVIFKHEYSLLILYLLCQLMLV
ncbi:Uncharacterised protein [Vibrio cholerae]|nr:Uncharacterised protein [Vibrio cholerae]